METRFSHDFQSFVSPKEIIEVMPGRAGAYNDTTMT